MKFEIYSMEQLVNNKKAPIFESDFLRETKTLIILKNGLRFSKKDKWALKSKENQKILRSLMTNNQLFEKMAKIID